MAEFQCRVGLQSLGECSVCPDPLSREQILQQCLAEQLVPERVTTIRVCDQHASGHGWPQRGIQRGIALACHRSQHAMPGAGPAHRGGPQHLLRLLGQLPDHAE